MNRLFRPLQLACALTVATASFVAAPASAQTSAAPATLQTSLAADMDNLSTKFAGLARVMAGKYDWKPGTGVRSVGEVLNLIVNENRMLVTVLTGAPAATGPQPAPITDAAAMQTALTSSAASARQAIAGLSAADLGTSVKLFGRDMTKQAAVLLLLMDQHEHLGQSIAYARSNNVVPPWSKQ